MRFTLLALVLVAGCFHSHHRYAHRNHAVDLVIDSMFLLAEVGAATRQPEVVEQPPVEPPPPMLQERIDEHRTSMDRLAERTRQLAQAGDCSGAARTAHIIATRDRDYFAAYVAGDPALAPCIAIAPDGTRSWVATGYSE